MTKLTLANPPLDIAVHRMDTPTAGMTKIAAMDKTKCDSGAVVQEPVIS